MSDDTKGTEPMTEDELARIDARVSKATKGPLRVNRYDNDGGSINWQLQQDHGKREVITNIDDLEHREARGTAEFFKHAVEDVPRLLAEVRRLREALASIAAFAPAARSAEDATTLYDIAITMAKEANAALG